MKTFAQLLLLRAWRLTQMFNAETSAITVARTTRIHGSQRCRTSAFGVASALESDA